MIRTIVHLVKKDLLRRARSPLGILLTLAFPVVFAGMLAATFGTSGDPEIPKVRLLVEDRDEGFVSNLLGGALTSEEFGRYFDVREVGEDGLEMMDKGEGSALLILPEGFTEALLEGTPTTIRLVRNPAEGILPEIAEQATTVLAEGLDAVSRLLRGPLEEIRALITDEVEIPTDEEISRIAVSINRTMRGTGNFLLPPAITLETVQLEEEGDAQSAQTAGSVFLFVFPGVAVFGLFMLGDLAMRDVLTEAAGGTLRRQMSGPVGSGTIVLAKALMTATLSTLCLIILAVVGWGIARAGADPAGFVLLSLSVVLSVTGFAAVIYGLARTERQGGTVGAVVYMFLAFSSGIFIQLDALPAILRRVAPVSPFYWANEGFRTLLAKGGGVADILPNVAILSLMGVVLLIVGSFLLGRSVRRGLTG